MPKYPRSSPNPIRVIDVLTYPAVQLLDVTGPVQVFASANDLVAGAGGARPYMLRVVSQGDEGVTASAGVVLAAGPLTQHGEALDTLLVAGGEGAEAAAENPVQHAESPRFAPEPSCSLRRCSLFTHDAR